MSNVAHKTINKAIRGGAFAFPIILGCASAYAQELNAGVVMKLMTSEQRGSYLQGVVEGLAYARYQRDGDADGMQCIYKAWYDGDNGMLTAIDAFERFPDHTPGALMAALFEKECPS